jgi:hypothetical protein
MAINLYAEFGTDVTKSEEGTWVKYDENGTEFLIARAMNKSFKRALQRAYQKVKNIVDVKPSDTDAKQDMAESTDREMMADCYSKHILLGWKGLVDAKGEVLDYSPAVAKEMLKDPALVDFRSWVETQSQDMKNFKIAELEEAAKK